MSVIIAVLTVWITMTAGVLRASVFMDAWERQCREHYWPERLRSGKAFVLLLVLAPAGFVIALYSAHRMRKNPLPPPQWAVEMHEDLERNTRTLKALGENLQQMSATLSESIAIVETAVETVNDTQPQEER